MKSPHLRGLIGVSAAAAAVALWALPAQALVVRSGTGTNNNSAPAEDPGWGRVGLIGSNGTGVYLGLGWVLTVDHIADETSFTVGSDVYSILPGSANKVVLKNADNTNSDLVLWRVDVPDGSGLAAFESVTSPTSDLFLPSQNPVAGDNLVMIGTGLTRTADAEQFFTGEGNGFVVSGTRMKLWGTNQVASTGLSGRSPTDLKVDDAFNTNFTRSGLTLTTHEAQGVGADSGAPAFIKRDERWELAGLLFATARVDQTAPVGADPGGHAINGTSPNADETYFANLNYGVYRDQIAFHVTPEPASLTLLALGGLLIVRRARRPRA